MRRLLLMRHAKAAKQGPTGGRDRDRPLEPRGRSDAEQIGTYLHRRTLLPDLALVSTALRARETWDHLSAGWPRIAVEHRDDLYNADAGDLLAVVRAVAPDPQCILLLAHNPGLHEFALALTSGAHTPAAAELADHLPTGAVVVIDFAVRSWNEVSFRRGRLDSFVSPRQLKDAG